MPTGALDGVLDVLTCPVCAGPLSWAAATGDGAPSTLGCRSGHRFDLARAGYVALLSGRSAGLSSDSAAMIAARRAALDTPAYRAVRAAVADLAAQSPTGGARPLIVDAGCGTGQYLAGCLDARPSARGLGLDLSKYAARSAAKSHPRAAAVVADLWQRWPLADACVDVVLAIFAPRGFDEARRVLAPGGTLLVVTPRAEHLHELIEPMGMLGVAPDKHDGLLSALAAAGFSSVSTTSLQRSDSWDAGAVADAVAMGPSAFHTDTDELGRRAEKLCAAGPVEVTTAVDLTVARS